jgi:hypothetical protein
LLTLKSRRRETLVAKGIPYEQINWDLLRKGVDYEHGLRSVLLWANMSPCKAAAAMDLQPEDVRWQCIWPGCSSVGTWHHIAWERGERPARAERRPLSA